MVWSKITYYGMLTPERHYEIQQEIQARQASHAARITVVLPPDSSGEAEEEEMALMEVGEAEEAKEAEQQVSAFNMEQAEAESAAAQFDEMAEQ